jgi:hypothetical protein
MNYETTALGTACGTFDVPIPANVTTAEHFATVCRGALKTITSETTAPPLSPTATERQVLDWITRQVDTDRHDRRLGEARTLVKRSEQGIVDAWQHSAHVLFDAFRGPFDKTVAALTTVLPGSDDLGLPGSDTYQAATAAAGRIADLEAVHETLTGGGRGHGSIDGNIIRAIRVLSMPSKEDYSSRLRVRTGGLTRMSAPWLATMLAAGCRLRWSTLADIETEWQATPAQARQTAGSAA